MIAALLLTAVAHHGVDDGKLLAEALERRCYSCHGAEEKKGGLRLDDAAGLLSTIVPGEPDESELLYRVTLPADDFDVMPPSGDGFTEAEVGALRRWITAGAKVEALGAAKRRAEERREAAEALVGSVREATGARIDPVAPDLGVAWDEQRFVVDWGRAVDAGEDGHPTGEQLAALEPLAERVHELRLAGTGARDAALESLPTLPGLRRAHLERTQLGDTAVLHLAQRAPGLRYLNLHSTAVTAAALPALGTLADLERLALFGTALGEDDVRALRDARPELRVTTATAARTSGDPFGARQPRRILAADASQQRIALLREIAIGQPEVLWEHPVRQLHDLQWLGATTEPHGRVLFQETWTKLLEVDTATGEVLWTYDAAKSGEGPVEVHSFRRLPDGTTMVAESGRSRIVLVSPTGEIEHVVPLQVERPDVHRDTRLVRPTPRGTFLVAHEGEGVAREYDRDGQVVWEYAVPLFERERAPGHGPDAHGNQLFAAVRLAGGDTLITTGNGSSLLRVAPDGTLRSRVDQREIEGVTLAWTTTIQELSNGHLVLGNCHAGPDQPQLIELDARGERVWSFRDFERFGNALSNAYVIEEAP